MVIGLEADVCFPKEFAPDALEKRGRADYFIILEGQNRWFWACVRFWAAVPLNALLLRIL